MLGHNSLPPLLPSSLLKTETSGTPLVVVATLAQQQVVKAGHGTEHLVHHLTDFHLALHML